MLSVDGVASLADAAQWPPGEKTPREGNFHFLKAVRTECVVARQDHHHKGPATPERP